MIWWGRLSTGNCARSLNVVCVQPRVDPGELDAQNSLGLW